MKPPPGTGSTGETRLLDPSRVAHCFDGGADEYEEIVWRNRRGAERLVASLPIERCEHVLDVGCGTGFASLALLERFQARSITGVDLSARMLEHFHARLSRCPDLVIGGHQADVIDMPVAPGGADLVITCMAFHWFPDRRGAVDAMAAALRPGGVLGILTGREGTEQEYRELLLALEPAGPGLLTEIYDSAVGLEEMERLLLAAGLDPVDVWIERRRRVSPPERFLTRWRLVADHLIADLPADEQSRVWDRIGEGLAAHCGAGDFVYHFNKLYATARKR